MADPGRSAPGPALADVGVLGGSGFYSFLEDAVDHEVETPWGPPAAAVAVGRIGDRRVAFLPRHGRRHQHPAHVVPYRANVWALHRLGVRALVGPCAAGSLRRELEPGHLVVCDQLVDRTWGRASTFFDGPEVHHQSFADPYDAGVRAALVAAARRTGMPVHDGGTMVVVQGPRFSTRAESAGFVRDGYDVINMTGMPEAVLAAELGIRYATLALVTDYDAGLAGGRAEAVTQEAVFAAFEASAARMRDVLRAAIDELPLGDGPTIG